MPRIRWVGTQLAKEARELRRSLVGLVTVLAWAGVSVVFTAVFFNLGQRYTSTADVVYNYWSQLLVLSFPLYLYPTMTVAGEAESGRWEFLRGVRVAWWRMVLGKWVFGVLLTGGLVLLAAGVFAAGLAAAGFSVSGTALGGDWPSLLLEAAALAWLALLPVVSQGLFFSCALPNRPSALIVSLGFVFVATFAASNLYGLLVAPASGSVIAVPAWALAVLLLSPAFLAGVLAAPFGLVRHTVTVSQGGVVLQQTVGYPVLGSPTDYLAWIVAEAAAFLLAAVLVIAIKERRR